ncbi:MAG: hypothetical protein KKE62_10815 [Proteobacteria bacterium]|nr:hypothetical protein [Pseudomonadota bacterium]MBU1386708.1 hypothetical protein [Pseudomonadota bacterium]MBU1543319.1 hypothetical protein [Pseudomonadota bacterium]MBU2483150.1 hypothetical protein [Pseudomonadota bacterium]
MLWFNYPQFAGLGNSIKSDLNDIFVAKGFSVRGPFDSPGQIPYSDKKTIDMFIVSQVEFQINVEEMNILKKQCQEVRMDKGLQPGK